MNQKFSFITRQKLLILAIFVLKFQIEDELLRFVQNFKNDFQICPECFENQKKTCWKFFDSLEIMNTLDIQNVLTVLSIGHRQHSVFRLLDDKGKGEVRGKYLSRTQQKELEKLKMNGILLGDTEKLAAVFHQNAIDPNLNGIQFCPITSIQRFIDLFKASSKITHNERLIWLYMLVSPQSLLMPYLNQLKFPVPFHQAICGFSIFQENAGKTLSHFYQSRNFSLKISVAKQLLKMMLLFSDGLEEFRIYITDLSADNLVYDETLDRLALIDIDTVYIVDSRQSQMNTIHKHEYIDCTDCFAYTPQQICHHRQSDINIFSACQLLREDLKRDKCKGFLQPIPHKYSRLIELLDECVDCIEPQCKNRISVALDLIKIMEII